jgi:type IV secretory pathway TraG/TraD family ATPase VirD4
MLESAIHTRGLSAYEEYLGASKWMEQNPGATADQLGKGDSSSSTSTNKSDNWGQHGRKLLKPEEVLALPHRIAITFTPGVPPIWTTLVRYFEERNLGQEPVRPGRWKRFKAAAKIGAGSLVLLAATLFLASAFFVNSQGRVATRQPPVNNQQRFQNP